jgi:hypothetical protein
MATSFLTREEKPPVIDITAITNSTDGIAEQVKMMSLRDSQFCALTDSHLATIQHIMVLVAILLVCLLIRSFF